MKYIFSKCIFVFLSLSFSMNVLALSLTASKINYLGNSNYPILDSSDTIVFSDSTNDINIAAGNICNSFGIAVSAYLTDTTINDYVLTSTSVYSVDWPTSPEIHCTLVTDVFRNGDFLGSDSNNSMINNFVYFPSIISEGNCQSGEQITLSENAGIWSQLLIIFFGNQCINGCEYTEDLGVNSFRKNVTNQNQIDYGCTLWPTGNLKDCGALTPTLYSQDFTASGNSCPISPQGIEQQESFTDIEFNDPCENTTIEYQGNCTASNTKIPVNGKTLETEILESNNTTIGISEDVNGNSDGWEVLSGYVESGNDIYSVGDNSANTTNNFISNSTAVTNNTTNVTANFDDSGIVNSLNSQTSSINSNLNDIDDSVDNMNSNLVDIFDGDNLRDNTVQGEGDSYNDNLGELHTAIQDSPIVSSFNTLKSKIVLSAPVCPGIVIDLSQYNLWMASTTIHCDILNEQSSTLGLVMLVVWSVVGFKILASA